MNEHQLGRLLRRMVVLSAPLPLALLGAACGGSSMADTGGEAGASAGGKDNGSVGGSPNRGAGEGGAGTSAGEAGASGGGAGGAGAGGSGTGGASAGMGGVGAVAGGGSAGSAGMGAGGDTSGCKSAPLLSCFGGEVVVPNSCVAPAAAQPGTVLPSDTCSAICNAMFVVFQCSLTSSNGTSATVQCVTGCPGGTGGSGGRRPAGFGDDKVCDSADGLGGYFAEMARLEAASVDAFRIMRDELRVKGAPKKLVRAAARAAKDEIRHARATGALARRFGSSPRATAIPRGAPRSIEAMALENAVEGCVRETYGALLATRQAELASDPVVRAAMIRIARDETRHACLSWRVTRWLEIRLDPEAKRNVERAKQAAVRELMTSVATGGAVSFAVDVGLPAPAEASLLLVKMKQALWS